MMVNAQADAQLSGRTCECGCFGEDIDPAGRTECQISALATIIKSMG
jgi:hypothetical protein